MNKLADLYKSIREFKKLGLVSNKKALHLVNNQCRKLVTQNEAWLLGKKISNSRYDK